MIAIGTDAGEVRIPSRVRDLESFRLWPSVRLRCNPFTEKELRRQLQ